LFFGIKFKYGNHEALNKQIFVNFILWIITDDDKVIRVNNQKPFSLSKAYILISTELGFIVSVNINYEWFNFPPPIKIYNPIF